MDGALVFVICIALFLVDKSVADIFDVRRYGAVGDGVHDDTKAFNETWAAACLDEKPNPTMLVPSGKSFLVRPITFQGPCKSINIQLQVLGSVEGPDDEKLMTGCEDVSWIYFQDVLGLSINGSGTINGHGQRWWKTPSRRKVKGSCIKPTAVHFNSCTGLTLSGISIVNSSRNHISISYCHGVAISNIRISVPEDSVNTDGIDISHTTNLQMHDSIIQSGDDCIAINTGCSKLRITGISCGPGHGISIGSLGKNNAEAKVENVYVANCTLEGTTNGVRIKTWQGGSGYARSIHFENIKLKDVENPIIIDQKYCNGGRSCKPQPSAVQVEDITYKTIYGSTISKAAISLNCSDSRGCNSIDMEYVNITPSKPGKHVFAVCSNANGTLISTSPHVPCLSKR